MARFLFATAPSPGHVGPASAVAEALTGRGHDVRWYTGRSFERAVTEAGARFCAMPEALDWDYRNLDAAFPGRSQLKGVKQIQFDMVEIFVRPLREHLVALKALLTEEPADAFVSHFAFYGGGWLHEMGGPPNATLGDTCLAYPSRDVAPFGMGLAPRSGFTGHVRNRVLEAIGRATVLAPAFKAAQELRADLGLPPAPKRALQLGFFFSQFLHIQLCPAGFEYPRSDLPAFVHFVGAPWPRTPADFDPPSWWPRLLESKRVVLVTQGTIATEPADLLAPSLEGLADRDVFVVATTGGVDPGVLGTPPPNAVVERFVPYGALMPHVSVMVSNGGFGSVQLAIAHGVPMVVAGTTEDKGEISARVAWSGVGINLRTNRPSPSAVADAVERVLNDPGFRDRTLVLRAQSGDTDPSERAADLLEELALGGAPQRASARNTTDNTEGDMAERATDELSDLTPKQRRYVRNGHRMAQRHPRGARFFSKVNRDLIRLTGGRVGASMQGVKVGLLTTTGRLSGRARTVPVVYLDDGFRFLVAASNSGLGAPPAWCLNLRAKPTAELHTRAGTARVVARELSDAEREEGWTRLLAYNPMLSGYQSLTDRQIALFALERPNGQGAEISG